jgi:hypothetical protein
MDLERNSPAAKQQYSDVAQSSLLVLSVNAFGYLASETILKPKRMTGSQENTQAILARLPFEEQ